LRFRKKIHCRYARTARLRGTKSGFIAYATRSRCKVTPPRGDAAAQRGPVDIARQWQRDGFTRRLSEHGYRFPERHVHLYATPARERLRTRIATAFPGERLIEDATPPLYDGLRFMISVAGKQGNIPLVDGGAFDWLGKLTSNQRLVFVASGMGSQLAALLWRPSWLIRIKARGLGVHGG
jgi:hypothetical protein